MKRGILVALFFIGMLLAASSAAAAEKWIHVTVDDTSWGTKPQHVTVNVPFSLIETVVPLIPKDALRDARIDFDHGDVDAAEIRALIDEIRHAPDGDIAVIRDRDGIVRAERRGGSFVLQVEQHGRRDEHVEINVPMELVAALATGDTLDLKALVSALARRGEGEIVLVHDRDSHVRIWIDENPDASRGR